MEKKINQVSCTAILKGILFGDWDFKQQTKRGETCIAINKGPILYITYSDWTDVLSKMSKDTIASIDQRINSYLVPCVPKKQTWISQNV